LARIAASIRSTGDIPSYADCTELDENLENTDHEIRIRGCPAVRAPAGRRDGLSNVDQRRVR
jgi:hypothetical protein